LEVQGFHDGSSSEPSWCNNGGKQNRKPVKPAMLEYSISLTQTSDLVQQLRTKGGDTSCAILMFDPPATLPGPSEAINLQYSIDKDTIGLDWVLLGPRNIADEKPLTEFIRHRGHAVEERVMNGVLFLRVEDGDIEDLGVRIATEFYQLQPQTKVGLLTAGFDFEPGPDDEGAIELVRWAVRRSSPVAEVDRVAAVLRLISGKTRNNHGDCITASAEFRTAVGYIRFIDVLEDDDSHRLLSEVASGPQIREIEKAFTEKHSIDLLLALGYGRPYEEGDYLRWFVEEFTNDGFKGLAEIVLGILHLLLDHRSRDLLEVEFFVPGPDLDELPDWDELPDDFRKPYCDFKARYYGAVAKYHNLMAREDGEPYDPKTGMPTAVFEEMQIVLGDFPTFLDKLSELGTRYDNFLAYALDNQTELSESLNMLCRRYRAQIFN
jgi:hypothetical protein